MTTLAPPRERPATIAPRADAAAANACRNCGAQAAWNYCPNCGQETRIELPSALAFLRDAAGRYVRFDGRMWRSLGALLFRPGFLTREYLAGRRRRYVAPARLFVALSIVLFAVMRFTAVAPTIRDTGAADPAGGSTRSEVQIGSGNVDSKLDIDLGRARVFTPIRTRIEAFNRLPPDVKAQQVASGMFRYAPYAAIALLPFFALLVALAYVPGRRRHPARPQRYAAHLVFGAHLHAFAFVVATLFVVTPWAPLRTAQVLGALAYALVALKTVYGGRWPGVALRALLIAFFYLVLFSIASVAVVVAAVLLR